MPGDPDVPEADAFEQVQPRVNEQASRSPSDPALSPPRGGGAGQGEPGRRPSSAPWVPRAFEVPEADALEQAQEVPLDDDDRR